MTTESTSGNPAAAVADLARAGQQQAIEAATAALAAEGLSAARRIDLLGVRA